MFQFAVTLLSALALCAATPAAALAAEFVNPPVGLGSLVGKSGDTNDYAFVVEGNNHFNQKKTAYGVRQYGFAQSRLELGTGVGVNMAATSGITLYGVGEKSKLSPHLGIEPFSGRISLNSSGDREDFYEWLPMMAIGPQFVTGRCRVLLPLVRAGGALGNLGKSGILPAAYTGYGGGAYFNCPKFNFAVEATRIDRPSAPIFLNTADLDLRFASQTLRLGIRAEQISEQGNGGEILAHLERRMVVVFRIVP